MTKKYVEKNLFLRALNRTLLVTKRTHIVQSMVETVFSHPKSLGVSPKTRPMTKDFTSRMQLLFQISKFFH